jgi:hypothetical protein
MCNLYSIRTNQAAIINLFRVINRYLGNLAPMPGVFPDYPAPVVRNTDTGPLPDDAFRIVSARPTKRIARRQHEHDGRRRLEASSAGNNIIQQRKKRSGPHDALFTGIFGSVANVLGADWTVRPLFIVECRHGRK